VITVESWLLDFQHNNSGRDFVNPDMVEITVVRPHMLRIAIVAVCLLTLFLFFDPIGFASSSSAANNLPGTTTTVTHIVLFQFKHGADPVAIDTVRLIFHSIP
jgi:hypothetical protein